MLIAIAVILGVIIVSVLFIVGIYNSLVTGRNRYENAFSQIDVQLKRRYDLIPNLVETAKAFMSHERETFEAVTRARNQAQAASNQASANPGDPAAMKNLIGAESSLNNALGRLMVTVEAYPELKANQQMGQLQEELTSTENRISFARQAYNDAVTSFNINREKFPAVLIAGSLGFRQAMLFEIEVAQEREAPRVAFG